MLRGVSGRRWAVRKHERGGDWREGKRLEIFPEGLSTEFRAEV